MAVKKAKISRPPKKKGQWEDHYTRKARDEKYPARSVYKLQEIQRKFTLIKKGAKVLDLGCSPGSWLLYAAELAGGGGRVVGIDLKPVTIKLPSHAEALVGDILALTPELEDAFSPGFTVVISDMAPATTGMKDVDAARSLELCEMALTVATERLHPGGHFVCKIFQGGDFDAYVSHVKERFRQVKIFKPESCRKQSKEIYVVGLGMKE
ncbi:RlmE family RNA methyltransferase [Desulfoluna spongiiphila]|uniref:Ribosomal RNA large subunit methyltransferase E n=1 Tax=Desulfoluna spongiiphila TaxID=419481 RepID=A0A1G5IPI5_9BACT|nr:RlmE family RNA methyltransferase [Desulfoluna spongiiphila]SCY77992.1 23S rRNA Um-2552 2'-O-methyltransferase [Desulfoluna spongiiphila]VVS92579.1 ribosomal rna large subunit methyltransferase e [Desulfoluna spongiiphila]